MTAKDILSVIATRLIQGMMFHEQMMNAYLFLGLEGYAMCHEYHYFSETNDFVRVCKYSIDHYGELVKANRVYDPNVFPESWYGMKRYAANFDKKAAVSSAMAGWVDWEKETKATYAKAYNDLLQLNDVPCSEFVKELILEVTEEMVYAENDLEHKEFIGFDEVSMMEEQKTLKKEFKKRRRMIK